MKVAIAYNTWEGYEEYPGADIEKAAGKKSKRRKKIDREAIADALKELGHEPEDLPVDGKNSTLSKIAKADYDLIFNLVESYGGDDTKEMHFAAFLELVGKQFTGAGPQALHLAMEKAIAKKIIGFHDINTPNSAVVYEGRVEHAHDVHFPLIVKPANEDASKGIDADSVVSSIKELMERIAYIHDEFDSPALIEEYIEGREIYAAVIGNGKPEALPLIELDLSKLPHDTPKIAGYEVKFDVTSDAYKKTKSAPAESLDEALTEEIQRVAVMTFKALKFRDYGRIDLRVTKEGKIFVIEANPNPWLDPSAEFMMAAKESGRSYRDVIGEIVECAMERYR